MVIWFTFRYDIRGHDPADLPSPSRREYETAHFACLFEQEPVFLRKMKLYTTFVQEYHQHHGPQAHACYRGTAGGVAKPMLLLTLQVESVMRRLKKQAIPSYVDGLWRGPSTPFHPQEMRQWARIWIDMLRNMGEEEREALLHQEAEWTEDIIRDLEEIISLANRAQRDECRLIMEITA